MIEKIVIALLAVVTLNVSVVALILLHAWKRWQSGGGWQISIEEIDDAFDWDAAEAQMREGPSVDHS